MKSFQKLSKLSLILNLILTGCTVQSPLLDSEPNRHNIIIIKPPMKVIVTGEVTDKEHEQIMEILRSVEKIPFKDYHFRDNINHVIISDSKGDSENINLHLPGSSQESLEYEDNEDNSTIE